MFYNTGIGTYIWIVTNRKEKRRKGKIQLLDARDIWAPGGSEEREGVGPEDLRGEGVVEPGVGQVAELVDDAGERLVHVENASDAQQLCHVPGTPRVVCQLCPSHCLGESPDGGERAEHPPDRIHRCWSAGPYGG